MNYTTAHSPVWADSSATKINLFVDFTGFGELPFTASANDPEPHGAELFDRAVAGEFGVVAAFVEPVLPTAEIIADYTRRIQKRLDDFAKTRNYDGILSACTYAASLVPQFAAEGSYCVVARDNTWAASYTIMAAVQAAQRPMPTWPELEAELPPLEWPA